MKVAEIYMNKEYFAEKLGIKENQFVIGDIKNEFETVVFRVFVDNDAEIKSSVDSVDLGDNQWNIKRHKLDSLGDE